MMEPDTGMSSGNEVRHGVASILLQCGLILYGVQMLLDESWSMILTTMSLFLMTAGGVMLGAVFLVEGLPELARSIWQRVTPEWHGEQLSVAGLETKLRYMGDLQGKIWFVAEDVCMAIGERAPIPQARKWGGAMLFQQEEHICFSTDSVQAYLLPLTVKNRAAGRVLTEIRNQVLRQRNLARFPLAEPNASIQESKHE